MRKTLVLLMLALPLYALLLPAAAKYGKDDFIGVWYYIDGNENVDTRRSLEISEEESGLAVRYKNEKDTFQGTLAFSDDGRSLTGQIAGFGKVIIGKIRSTSPVDNAGLFLEQVNEFENISIGDFQKESVLRSLKKIR